MDKESTPDPPEPEAKSSGITAFWAELKRRHVVRVAMVYLVVGWLVIQVANATFEDFGIPVWAYRFVVLMVALGFPISVVVAWAFELTPEGIKTTKKAKVQKTEEPVSSAFRHKRQWFTILFAAGLPTLIFGALAVYFYATRSNSSPSTLDSSPSTHQVEGLDKSIAVLPLINMSPDPNNAFFADGVQEDILTNLSKIEELGVVISRSSTLKYRDPDRNLKQVGQELGVRYIVEGSVRRAANQVLVTVQLIDSVTDDHIWAENYNRELTDIFAIQAEVAKEIANQLKAAISPNEIEKIEYRPTQNQEAYDAFIKARQAFNVSRHQGESYAFAKEAVRLDPQFSDAWAFLAYDAIVRWNYLSGRTEVDYLNTARLALDKAEKLDPDTPYVLFARSTYHTHHDSDRRSAISLLERAISIDPSFYFARWELGILLHSKGDLAESRHHLEVAVRIDPLSDRANETLIAIYEALGLWNEAQTLIEKNINRSSRQNWWRLRLAQSEFLQTGKKQPLVDAWKLKIYPDKGSADLWLAADARDYNQIINLIQSREIESNIVGMMIGWGSDGLSIRRASAIALSWLELGNRSQAIAVSENRKLEYESSETLSPIGEVTRWSFLSITYALENRPLDVDNAVETGIQLYQRSYQRLRLMPIVHTSASLAYLVLGDEKKAIEMLEMLDNEIPEYYLNRKLQLWPFFDRLRGNPRFDALLK